MRGSLDDLIDILVNNAGYFGPTLGLGTDREKSATLKNLTRDEVLDCFAVNAAGSIFVTQALMPNLNASKQAKVVVISSRSGIINQKRHVGAYGYRISKTAVKNHGCRQVIRECYRRFRSS